ncbi:MAG: (d)CMP kinase [Bacilli bacterium]|jgi:cytidylate kinase|nr:(d)CMP kinase [Bacilli bacterium]
MKKEIIVIDGPAASGKSTVAKLVAQKLNYKYIDSGAMYRCVALYKLENNLSIGQLLNNIEKIKIDFDNNNHVFLNDKDVSDLIRSTEVSKLVSEIAKISKIRAYLVSLQQSYGKEKGIVMDGRDIGSVVFPEAKVKIYQVASVETRAKRRFNELLDNGKSADYLEICNNIKKRDYDDMNREVSPLIKVDDAYELDTSNMSIDEVVNKIIEIFNEKVK